MFCNILSFSTRFKICSFNSSTMSFVYHSEYFLSRLLSFLHIHCFASCASSYYSTLINQFFQLILFLSVLISILQNFIIYFQLHSPKLLYFLPIIASFWEIIKCVGIIILLSFFLPFQQLHRPFHRSFRAHMHLQFPLTDAGKSFLQHRQIPRGSSLGQNGA